MWVRFNKSNNKNFEQNKLVKITNVDLQLHSPLRSKSKYVINRFVSSLNGLFFCILCLSQICDDLSGLSH